MNLPRLHGGVRREADGSDRRTAGVEPAFKVSCHCDGGGKQPVRSCTCEWLWGSCCGSSTSNADGSWEASHGCGVTCDSVRDHMR